MSEAKFTTYPKYKLNHGDDTEKGSIVDALGLDDDFANMVIKTLRIAEIEHKKYTESWEDAINKILPQNAMEAFYVGWIANKMYERHKSGGENPLLKMLMGMRGE